MKSTILSFIGLLCCLIPLLSQAQEPLEYQWFNPVKDNHIQFNGQGYDHNELASPYDRFPSKAENSVREAVWNLSRHTAGVYLTFTSDAPEIKIRYQTTKSSYGMPHMPSTGVSGLDLYVRSVQNENWLWCRGRYSFGDTITYSYSSLNTRHPEPGKLYEYELFLPLYNGVKWMEIGIPASAKLSAPKKETSKPVVVYGTSIAQGGCASRPGMAWTSILQRGLDQPVINLAFSGNGRLEEEVIDLINEIDASLYILDCLPNLGSKENYPDDELKKRIRESVVSLRQTHPYTPILLTDHAGYSDDLVSAGTYESVARLNRIQAEMFKTLKKAGVKNLYRLSKDKINMCMDCTVDGTHQTDLGMEYYGKAFLKKVRRILPK